MLHVGSESLTIAIVTINYSKFTENSLRIIEIFILLNLIILGH